MKLFRIKLSDVDYDTYDSAIIACESKQKLEELIENGVFDDFYRKPNIQYDYDFNTSGQTISSIDEIGYSTMKTDKEAIIVLSSFNAG